MSVHKRSFHTVNGNVDVREFVEYVCEWDKVNNRFKQQRFNGKIF